MNSNPTYSPAANPVSSPWKTAQESDHLLHLCYWLNFEMEEKDSDLKNED